MLVGNGFQPGNVEIHLLPTSIMAMYLFDIGLEISLRHNLGDLHHPDVFKWRTRSISAMGKLKLRWL